MKTSVLIAGGILASLLMAPAMAVTINQVWNATPSTHDGLWAHQNAQPMRPGPTPSGQVGTWRSQGVSGTFTAAADGYLTVKSCHNCDVIIYAGGVERCFVSARDKYGQGWTSCNAIIQKGETYSISGGQSAYWRDIR